MPFDPNSAAPASTTDVLRNTITQFDAGSATPIEKPGLLRKAADVGLAVGQGAVGATKAVSDAFGAGNPVSEVLEAAGGGLGNLESDQRIAERRQAAAEMKAAEGDAVAETVAALKAIGRSPVSLVAEGAGSILPTLVASRLGGNSVAGRIAAGAGTGAVQGAGAVKGSIHDTVLQAAMQAGAGEQDAQAQAEAAQAYDSPNIDQIMLGAGLGAAAAGTGVESAVQRILGKQAGGHAGILRETLLGAAKESIPEAIQGGQERYAGNVAAGREGFDVDPWSGVAGQAALEGIISAPIGGGIGAFEGYTAGRGQQQPAPTLRDELAAQPGPLSQAAATAIDSGAADQAAVKEATEGADEAVAKTGGKPRPDEEAQKADVDLAARVQATTARLKAGQVTWAMRNTPEFGEESVNELLRALAIARNPTLDPLVRQEAVTGAERLLDIWESRPNWRAPSTQPSAPEAVPTTALAPLDPRTGMVQSRPRAGQPNGATIDGEATRIVDALRAPAAFDPETAAPVTAAEEGGSTIPPNVERAALDAAKIEQDRANEFDLAEEIKNLGINGGINTKSLISNPEYWDAENEEFTQAGYDELERLTEETARDNLNIRPLNKLSDLDGAWPTAQHDAMKALLDGMGIEYDDLGGSPTSRYLIVGRSKIRFSDHENTARDVMLRDFYGDEDARLINVAPNQYTFGEALNMILAQEGIAPSTTNSDAKAETPRSGMQERPAVRADESGSLEEPAQENGAGGGKTVPQDAASGKQSIRHRNESPGASPAAQVVDQAAHEAATSPHNDLPQPTDGQKEAGNYQKGHIKLHGLDISIENPAGSERSGTDKGGRTWSVTMRHHYGYIRGTIGKDKDHIDTFIGPNPDSQQAFVVDQEDPKTGLFDEHKVMLGFDSFEQAKDAYLSNYEKGWKGLGQLSPVSVDALKQWLSGGNTKQPFGALAKSRYAARDKTKADQDKKKQQGTAAVNTETTQPAKLSPKERIAQRKEARENERQIYREKISDASLVGLSLEQIRAKVMERAANFTVPPADIDKLAAALHKELSKRAADLEKSKHRSPEVYADALSSAKDKDNIPADDPSMNAAYAAGFRHALEGRTKSTLQGEQLNVLVHGYEAARKWMRTEEGAAWYEGRPASKLQNTGVDLRRWYEQLQEQMKADESDVTKAWAQIEKATARADLFAPLLPQGVTPGRRIYVEELRSKLTPFKEWLMDSLRITMWGATAWKRRKGRKGEKTNLDYLLEGKRIPGELSVEDRQKFETDPAYRANWLRDQAAQYLEMVRGFLSVFDGATTLEQMAEQFSARYIKNDPKFEDIKNGNFPKGSDAANKFTALNINFDGRRDAFLAFRRHSAWTQHLIDKEATIALPDRAQPLTPPRLDHIERTGAILRRGDTTPADVKARFAFADIGFGKWVGAKQDQDHLNYAYDAFTDLATHFGTDLTNIGFGGRLHLTIGALGHGKFAAHFSPSQPSQNGPVAVINLTNTRGDGTVYHEWVHALDHHLGGEWVSRVRGRLLHILKHGVLTPQKVEDYARSFLYGGWSWSDNRRMSNVDAAVRGMNYGVKRDYSAYKLNANALGKDYWGNDEELIARAGEAWAADTMTNTNTYLVNAAWVGDGAVTKAKGYRGTPYPTGEERRLFNLVYTALAKSIKWENGKPTVTEKDFLAALPEELMAGEKRRNALTDREEMVRFKASEDAKRAEQAAAKEEAAIAKAEEERKIMEAAAAKAIAELDPAVVDEPQPSETTGPLSDNDLADIFDQAAAELREEVQEKPDVPATHEPLPNVQPKTANQPDQQADKSASQLIAEAAKLGVKGADEALKGLAKLFGGSGGKLNSFPSGFDEDTYQQAKPHFKAALDSFQAAGKSLKDLFKMLIQQFGDGIKEYAIRFAKDEGLTAQLGSQPSASSAIADKVMTRLRMGHSFDWRVLFGWADEAHGGTQAEGKYTPKDAYDAMEAGVNRWLMSDGGRLFNPGQDSRELALVTLPNLKRMTNLLPTQTKRTAEQDEFQQFSTVPALAYLANWVAKVGPTDTMLEPSAGIGGLAAFAHNAGAKLVLNELSSRRAAILREVFPSARIFSEDAAQINNVLPDDVQPTVVVMNPPFSSAAGRGIKTTQVGAQHVDQALARLADGGRLVAIVGEGMALDKPAFAEWWKKTRARYDVRAVMPMDGSGYAKYGTTFDNVLLVIDKVKPSGDAPVTTPIKDYEEAIPLLAAIRDGRPDPRIPVSDREAYQRAAAQSALGEPDAAGGDRTGPAQSDDQAGARVGDGDAGGGSALGTGRGSGGRTGGNGRSPSSVRQPVGREAVQRDDTGSGRTGDALASGGPDSTGNASGVTVQAAETKTAAPLTDSIFEDYQPQRLKVPGAKPHPGPLVQSAAMASVLPPAPTYTPNLPEKTIKDGLLSIAQLESVVYAGQAHGQLLESAVSDDENAKKWGLKPGTKYRRGFFIGDGTGVGKGREIGGILLDNIRQGRTKHVWVSEKQKLLNDAKRDFAGVGGDDAILFNQNKTDAAGRIDAKDGILFTTYSTLRSGAKAGKDASKGELEKRYLNKSVSMKVGETSYDVTITGVDTRKQVFTVTNNATGRHNLSQPFAGVKSIDGASDWKSSTPAKGGKKVGGPSRLDQLVEWLGRDFDGVIAFDEAHNAGNAVAIKGDRGFTEPSAQALAVIELQQRLPNARVVYVSATGATEVANLSFANRLGLWGESTPFPTVENFISQMEAGGLSTMELVARDMKQMGAYLARSLSFHGVTYSRVEHQLNDLQRDIYNRLAEAWQVTLQNFNAALEVTGATKEGKAQDKNAKRNAKSAFWGAQQRFFNQIITSMQMPSVIEAIEADLANGDAVLLQLVNTNEAQQDRALAKRRDDDESDELEDLDLTPRDQLISLVEKSFPVQQYEEYEAEGGKKASRPVVDSAGNPVLNREAVKMRDDLLRDLKQIRVPDGPLEIILNHFGPEIVAEVTGRKQRVIRKPGDDGEIRAQIERRGTSSAFSDADAFMADKKRILIFSDAGGTGFSFHADLTKKNQRHRSHYLIQPGWRANKAVQGLGRSHRSNQKSAPEFKLASTDIPAHKRFLSSIARRLDQLGALTKGQRDTSSSGLFSEKDNLESKYAQQAVKQLLEDARQQQIDGITFSEFMRQMGIEDIVNADTGQIAEDKYPATTQFLNRLLSLRLEMQEKVFDAFIARIEEKVELAAQHGELDTGMQTIRALKTNVLQEQTFYSDPRTGAETRYVEIELTQPTRIYPFPNVKNQGAKITWLVNVRSGKVWGRVPSGNQTRKDGSVTNRYRMLGTGGTSIKFQEDFKDPAAYREIDATEAEAMWKAESEARPATYTQKAHMLVGALLPIWDRIKTDGPMQVGRTQTEDGRRLLGRLVAEKDVPELRKRLDISSSESKLPPARVLARILQGEVGELANGWKIKRSMVSGELRVELVAGYLSTPESNNLKMHGVIQERIDWSQRYFLPTNDTAPLEYILKSKPLVALTPESMEQSGNASFDLTGVSSNPRATQETTDERAGKKSDTDPVAALNAYLSRAAGPGFRYAAGNLLDVGFPQRILAQNVARVFGKQVVYVTPTGTSLFNGAVISSLPDTIFISTKADRPELVIMGHELLHLMRSDRPDLYARLLDDLRPFLTGREGWARELNFKRKMAGMAPLTIDEVEEEMIADLVGERMLDEGFWTDMAKRKPGVFETLARYALRLIDSVLAAVEKGFFRSSRFVIDAKAAQKFIAKALAEYAGNEQKPFNMREFALQQQRDAGWNTDWPFVPADLMNADFRKLIASDSSLSQQEKQQIFSAGKKLGVVPAGGANALDVTDQTESAAFRKWFGDSVVTDNGKPMSEGGKPLMVYHGSTSDIEAFDPDKSPIGNRGMYFTPNSFLADAYARNEGAVYPVYLSIKNPLILDGYTLNQTGLKARIARLLFPKLYREAQAKQALKESLSDKDTGRFFTQEDVDALHAAGYDGVIAMNAYPGGDMQAIVAFDPAQIKSAIGNNGNFDPSNPDIRFDLQDDLYHGRSAKDDWGRFSRVGAGSRAIAGGLGVFRRAADVLRQPSAKTFGWVSNIRTQLDKALQDPNGFGRVFDLLIGFENDMRRAAARPAEMAKYVLPQHLDRVSSAFKRIREGRRALADMEKVSRVLFEGTLAGGSVNEGVVFNDDSLRMRGLTPRQIAMYRQTRAAIDASLDETAAALAYAKARSLVPEIKDALRDEPGRAHEKLREALVAIEDDLRERASIQSSAEEDELVPAGTAAATQSQANQVADVRNDVAAVFRRAEELKEAGYAPLMRFGRYTVTAYNEDEDGSETVAYFAKFDTEIEAKRAELWARGEFGRVERGIVATEGHKLFSGVDPETVSLFIDHIGDKFGEESIDRAALQEWYRSAMSERSAWKRLIHRKGTPGFDTDLERVLASFLTSQARFAAQMFNRADVLEQLRVLSKDKARGDVFDEAQRLADYLNNPADPFAAGRSLMFGWFLGGSISSAAVNLTQPVMMTLPYLSQWGVARAGRALARSVRDALGEVAPSDTALRQALLKAQEEGIVDPQEVHHLWQAGLHGFLSKLPGGAEIKARIEGAGALWGFLFGFAEKFNRRLTFIAAYRMAVGDKALGDPFSFAVRAVNETQGIYSKANRPNWARGTGTFGVVGSAAFTFKQYSIAYVELLARMARSGPQGRRAALLMLGILFLASGAQGLPGAEDAEDLLDTALQFMGETGNTRLQLRDAMFDVLGEELGLFALYGASSFLPIDVQSRLGLGNLLPATQLLKPSEDNRARVLSELIGPAGSMLSSVTDSLEAVESGRGAQGVAKALLPVAFKNAMQGYDMASTGMYRDFRGRKVVETDGTDAFIKGVLGFQPTAVSMETRPQAMLMQNIARAKKKEADIAELIARARFERDQDAFAKAQEQLRLWNESNPDLPIRIDGHQILRRVREMSRTRAERMRRQMSPELRAVR